MPELSALLIAAESLPAADIESLAEAAAEGSTAIGRLRARTGSQTLRGACTQLLGLLSDHDGSYLAGWLTGAAAAADSARRSQVIDVVWTGPESEIDTARFTSQVVADLVGQAKTRLLLASYATHPNERTITALADAIHRGVDITVLYERSEDSPTYQSPRDAFAQLPVRRLVWPAAHRHSGAALHPKFIVVDDTVALVGSANLTGRALDYNLECGVLIRGGPQPKSIADHIWSLVHLEILTSLPRPPLP